MHATDYVAIIKNQWKDTARLLAISDELHPLLILSSNFGR